MKPDFAFTVLAGASNSWPTWGPIRLVISARWGYRDGYGRLSVLLAR